MFILKNICQLTRKNEFLHKLLNVVVKIGIADEASFASLGLKTDELCSCGGERRGAQAARATSSG